MWCLRKAIFSERKHEVTPDNSLQTKTATLVINLLHSPFVLITNKKLVNKCWMCKIINRDFYVRNPGQCKMFVLKYLK